MAEYPILIFPKTAKAERAKRYGGGAKYRLPAVQQQAERLTPQFQRLQQAIDRQRLALQNNTLGLQPEQALVLETVGPIDDFIKAVKKVEGLEWLVELEPDDIDPVDGFEDVSDPQKRLKGQLFLVMTDQRALQELQSLFSGWKQNPNQKFPRGLAPMKHAFEHLYNIRPWDSQDRIRDTGLFEDWQMRITHGQNLVPFVAELWFRGDANRRQQSEAYLNQAVTSLGGEIIQKCVISEIAYHGILGRIPADTVKEIIAEREVRLLQCEDIWYLRPVGQCAVHLPENLSDTQTLEDRESSIPKGSEPIIALFDGLPLTGHSLLDGRLIVDDPDGYESSYQAKERVHGTAMASLICHGELDEGGQPLGRTVYARPIMKPLRGFDGQFFEQIPEDVLPVDLIHRAVRRLFESEEGNAPVAPSVRVINLSICDGSRPFVREMSSLGRLLDWLSWKHNVLFMVSAGNHSQDIELDIPRSDLRNLSANERESAIIKAIVADTRHRRLLSPAETINGLTLGASHSDKSTLNPNSNQIDPFARQGIPSTFSAHGLGYRRSIKPDIFFPGGRQFLTEKMGNTHSQAILQQSKGSNQPPGQCVASPGPSGELNRKGYFRGTSDATALASRAAAFLFDVLSDLRVQHGANLHEGYNTVLLKALLAHGADWAQSRSLYESILHDSVNSRTFKDHVGRFLGYGVADIAKVGTCTDQRVTVIGIGSLGDGEADEFHFPLPPSLSAVTEKRRLTITLAWLTPVNCQRQSYRVAHLWFDPKNDLAPTRMDADFRAVTRGTLQHEVLEGNRAVDFQDGNEITIKVNCRAEAGDIPEPVRYGLVVTLEVAEGIALPIYQEIRDRLRIRIPVTGGGAI